METLKPLIEQLVKLIQGGADVVNGQMPDLAKQIVSFYLWGNVIEIPILIGFLVAGVYAARWVYRRSDADDNPWLMLWIPIGTFEICVGVYAYGCTQAMLTAIFAPKLIVIQTLMSFLKH